MKKETAEALMAQRNIMAQSLNEAIRSVSERVWDEAVAACQEQAKIASTSEGFKAPDNPHTVEAVERTKQEAEQWEHE